MLEHKIGMIVSRERVGGNASRSHLVAGRDSKLPAQLATGYLPSKHCDQKQNTRSKDEKFRKEDS
jgi:hypothetical protein